MQAVLFDRYGRAELFHLAEASAAQAFSESRKADGTLVLTVG